MEAPPINAAEKAAAEDYWSEDRQRTCAWLEKSAQPLSELYAGTLRIFHNRTFPGRVRFVAHGVREIMGRLPGHIVGQQQRTSLRYADRVQEICDLFKSAQAVNAPAAVPKEGGPSMREMPVEVYDKIVALMGDHSVFAEKTVMESAFRLFESVDAQSKGARQALRPVVEQWRKRLGNLRLLTNTP